MVTVHKNVVTKKEIENLINWFNKDDSFVDERGDVRSKNPLEHEEGWPKEIIYSIINRIVDYEFEIRDQLVLLSRTPSVILHTDSDGNQNNLGDNILIPLWVESIADTIWFDNYYHGSSTKFVSKVTNRFEYKLLDNNNEWVKVEDIQIFLSMPDDTVANINGGQFTVDKNFKSKIESLIQKRLDGKYRPRITDYSKVENYNPNLKFDETFRQQFLKHIDIDSLHGLTIDKTILWGPGDVYVWPKSQIHAASSRHSQKIGYSVFLNRK